MLQIDINLADCHGIKPINSINIVRGNAHPGYKEAYWYDYDTCDDALVRYKGCVLHSYKNGAMALLQKVTKDVVRQQREAKNEQ